MQSQTLFVKVAVVSGFVLLLSGFVAYRSGFFDRYLYSPNGGNSLSNMEQYNPADTGKNPVDSTRNRAMMSSSKSMIMIDHSSKPATALPDTAKVRWYIVDSVMGEYKKDKDRELTYMSSSKSGPVISPGHPARKKYPVTVNGHQYSYSAPQIDSLLILQPVMDTVHRGMVPARTTDRMPSTKSGGIFRPADVEKQKKKDKKKNNQ